MKKILLPFISIVFFAGIVSTSLIMMAQETSNSEPRSLETVSAEIEQELSTLLELWYPRSVDPDGGFYTSFSREWKLQDWPRKGLIHQSRMTWTAAEVMFRRPQYAEQYLPIVKHGCKFLREKMWDQECGGFYWEVNKDGTPITDNAFMKHAYGESFAIYALATAYKVTKDPEDLEYAKRTFWWLDRWGHDERCGGYHESFYRDGRRMNATPDNPNPEFQYKQGRCREPLNGRSMNAHIHLLESFTVLYSVWPDDTLRSRLEELVHIIRDKVTTWPGAMRQFFDDQWTPAATYVSFGHDVETTYLLLEAVEAMGRPEDQQTWKVAKALTDHALEFGWDDTYGGFWYDGATFAKTPAIKSKFWWVQAEGLNTLLLLTDKFGKDNPNYYRCFVKQWDFIKNYIVDKEYKGWFAVTEGNGSDPQGLSKILNVQPAGMEKSHLWKTSYHEVRALLNVATRAERMLKDAKTETKTAAQAE